tara:strand:- start:5 stop:1543 length:1539 start_codon:yes stop_codon:yes gene_type:complete
MAKFTTNLTVTTPNETVSATKIGDYNVVVKINTEVDNADVFAILVKAGKTTGTNTLRGCKALVIRNIGKVGVELQLKSEEWAGAEPDTNGGVSYQSMLIAAGDFIYLPNLRQLNYETDSTSAANGATLDNVVPNLSMKLDSTADVDHATTAAIGTGTTETTLNLEDGHSKFFKIGDLIRMGDEICEITAVGTGADLVNSTCEIKRGMYGSTAETQADDVAVEFAFFNAYADFDKYSRVQSDSSGRYKATNFFGFARSGDDIASGLVAGSISGKFYSAGYQELGLSGITSSTESGLTASTEYKIDITVDGGTLFQDLSFTTSTNTKFGGSDGIIRKIQDAFDVQYYTAGNLFEKKVTVAIVDGDIRFTSGQHLATSAILLADTGDANSFLDAAANGRIPIAGNIEQAVPALLPDDVIYDNKTNQSAPNVSAMFYDDGNGIISGTCSGTINYETGAINLTGCPPNAMFVVSANYGSAHSGGELFGTTNGNTISRISGRSVNPKINSTVEIIGLQ